MAFQNGSADTYFPSGNKDARRKGKQKDGSWDRALLLVVGSGWASGFGSTMHALLQGRHGHANGAGGDWNSPARAVRESGEGRSAPRHA
jgi:hypothetical protein